MCEQQINAHLLGRINEKVGASRVAPVLLDQSSPTSRPLLDQVTLQAMETYLAATVGGDVCTSVEVAEAWLNRQEAVLA